MHKNKKFQLDYKSNVCVLASVLARLICNKNNHTNNYKFSKSYHCDSFDHRHKKGRANRLANC